MKCNTKTNSLIGERIRAARKEAGYSQENLINELQTNGYKAPSRNTLSKIEGGNEDAINSLSLSSIVGMSVLFGCDPGFLLGERDYRNHEVDLIHDKTGLSDAAIFKLSDIKENGLSDVLSKCLEGNIEFFLSIITGLTNLNDSNMRQIDIDGHEMNISDARMLEWFFLDHIREEIRTIAKNMTSSNQETSY